MKFKEVVKIVDTEASNKPLAVLMSSKDSTALSYVHKEASGNLKDNRNKLIEGMGEYRVIGYTETQHVLVITIERWSGHARV